MNRFKIEKFFNFTETNTWEHIVSAIIVLFFVCVLFLLPLKPNGISDMPSLFVFPPDKNYDV